MSDVIQLYANANIRIAELERENAALRVVLQEIAGASGFDNIGKWARNKAKDALRKEAQP